MGAIDPQVFAQNTDAKLRVWFSDGVNGFQQLSPDRPFASVPYAFNAGNATIADGSINKSMLGSDVIADLNATIGMNRLSSEVTAKFDQNGSGASGIVVGSLVSLPYGQSAPAGYSLYQQGTPKELVWEEKAPVSVARHAYDGVEVLGEKIYFVGGLNGSGAKNIAERYDPSTNNWELLTSMSVPRERIASATLNGKLYAIGGVDLSSVEIFDPINGNWTAGVSLPSKLQDGTSITVDGKIYLIGGRNSSNKNLNQVLCFDPSANQWLAKANMPTARHGHKLVWFENRIWAIGGMDRSTLKKVESYDPNTDSWQDEASLTITRNWPVAWIVNGQIYAGAGAENSSIKNSIEVYNPITKQWSNSGNIPESKYHADSVVINDKVYIIAGNNSSSYSDKVYAADLNASLAGVYDLYRKDGNAYAGTPLVQAEVADGSVTTAKIASNTITTSDLSEQILKYLKPEITAQPQAQTVYADSNVSFSFAAEGKYLSYQWKKDGSNLTGETNSTLTITDANATLHDGNYSVVVSNDFGSVESRVVEVLISDSLLNGLVGWWKFDEGSGTVAYDSSGNGNDGNLNNGPTWTTGKIGGALSFDGANDFLEVSNKKWFFENIFSVSMWYWDKGTISLGTAFSLGRYPMNDEILIFSSPSSNVIQLYHHKSENNWARLSHTSSNLSWNFLVAVADGGYLESQLKIYVNGVSQNSEYSKAGSPNLLSDNNNRTLRIGRRIWNDHFYNGLIDDVRIYDRAISAEEVQTLCNMGQ